jgi:hypothetical protein
MKFLGRVGAQKGLRTDAFVPGGVVHRHRPDATPPQPLKGQVIGGRPATHQKHLCTGQKVTTRSGLVVPPIEGLQRVDPVFWEPIVGQPQTLLALVA